MQPYRKDTIFPALYAMARRGVLSVPVVGVAAPEWTLEELRKQADREHRARRQDR
jgi:glucose-6-phosphate 1-dehydrogenase